MARASWFLLLLAVALPVAAQSEETTIENGTDPTRLPTSAAIQFESIDLRPGGSLGTWKLSYTLPFGAKNDWSLRFRAPIVRNTAFGRGGFGHGDGSVQLSHVFGVSRAGGMVVQGEYIADTASRPERGSGRNVLKGTFIYARFLADGDIIAPAIVHSLDLGGDSRRSKVDVTTLDFYYVPRLQNPRHFVTFDPALTFDWQNDARFASLAVTAGTSVGSLFGGNAQVFAKPTVFAGGDRPGDWGLEVGFRVLGF